MGNKSLKPSTIAIIGIIFFSANFVFDGILADLLGVIGVLLVVIGVGSIFNSESEIHGVKKNWDRIVVFIKKYKVFLLIGILIAGIFYWYEWRPAQVRKECMRIISDSDGFRPGQITAKYLGETYFDEEGYKTCLLKNGLEK